MLLVLYYILITMGSLISLKVAHVDVYGLTFTIGAILSTPVFLLRDIFEVKHQSLQAFSLTFPAVLVVYLASSALVDNPVQRATAFFISLTWAMLIDRNIYTYFRRWGWAVGVFMSDIVSVPMLSICYFYAYTGHYAVPDGQLIVKYLTLLVIYAILFNTRVLDRIFDGPRVKKIPRQEWFRIFDRP